MGVLAGLLAEIRKQVKDASKDVSRVLEHADGTYCSVRFSKRSDDSVRAWLAANGITVNDKLHATVIYSTTSCPRMADHNFGPHPQWTGIFAGWKILGENCLAIVFDSPGLQSLHKVLRHTYGATHTYPEYIVHVTIDYDFHGELADLPNPVPFSVEFCEPKVTGIKPNWSSKVKKG